MSDATDPPAGTGTGPRQPPFEHLLPLRPLTVEAFEAYGTVIEAEGPGIEINEGTSLKFADRCRVELDQDARAALHIYRPVPTSLPIAISTMERHPLASQAFVPLGQSRFAVIVSAGEELRRERLAGFLTDGRQGLQYAAGVWHHPLLALDAADYLVVDRFCGSESEAQRNLEVRDIAQWSVGIDSVGTANRVGA